MYDYKLLIFGFLYFGIGANAAISKIPQSPNQQLNFDVFCTTKKT